MNTHNAMPCHRPLNRASTTMRDRELSASKGIMLFSFAFFNQLFQTVQFRRIHPLIFEDIQDQQLRRVIKKPLHQVPDSTAAGLRAVDYRVVNERAAFFGVPQIPLLFEDAERRHYGAISGTGLLGTHREHPRR